MNRCFVCNYNELLEPPYDGRGIPSDEICPCCGFHYGYDDDDVTDKESFTKYGEITGFVMDVFGFQKEDFLKRVGILLNN